MSIRKPSPALLHELNNAVRDAPGLIKDAVGEKVISFLLALYPEWSNQLMDSIESDGGEFDPAKFLSLTSEEQVAFLKRLASENDKTKKRKVN